MPTSTSTTSTAELDQQISAAVESLSASAPAQSKVAAPFWSNTDAMTISTIFLGFALLVASMAAYLLSKGKPAQEVLMTLGTILVVSAATFIVALGYEGEQVAAAMGLLGTVAGYFLGKATSKT